VKHEARRSRAIPAERAGKNAPLRLAESQQPLSEQRDARLNNTIKKITFGPRLAKQGLYTAVARVCFLN
jgi:hypothetical protein